MSVRDRIGFQAKLGYDYVTVWPRNLNFPTAGQGSARDTASLAHDHRTFNLAGQGVLRDWADFERYPWPDPGRVDYREIAEAAACMPEGMKAIVLTGHVLEMPMALMVPGAVLCLYDEPYLVAAVFERVGRIFEAVYLDLAGIETVGAVLISDDLAFKTQTLMPPDFLKQYVFPWYRRYVEICHAKGVPVILHSCGNLTAVMEDLDRDGDRRQALV